ncbi:hypothetical protein ABFG93_01435 [Pseudalkalibacillus hwajinpoensis]|uniref:hypothetical protein n=1 Tax=Guptibacillus hwajinpoensis TaxID=208199 RepID=UPI00325BCC9C
MELVQCIRDVFEEEGPFLGSENNMDRKLFKEGNFYPVYRDENSWITVDEEGEQHIIATGSTLEEDFWFTFRFRIA